MIYLLLGAVCAWLGLSSGIGSTTLLRPLLDAVSPLEPAATSMLCTVATLSAALVSAFFALAKPLPLHRDELILLAGGAFAGGVLGDLISGRFFQMLTPSDAILLQNALLFTLIALPALYFSMLSHTLRPLSVTRLISLPAALLIGLLASFLAFGAVPLTLMAYYLLFDAEDDEAAPDAGKTFMFTLRAIIERDGVNTEELVGDGECPIFDKYDDFIPPELLREAYAKDRLRADEIYERFE